MRILSACRHMCSSFRASVSSSVIDNEAFSCIRFDIIKGWFFRRARSVILCKHFCCRSNTHISSLSNSCLQPGKLLVSSTKQSDSFLSTCTPCKQIERLKRLSNPPWYLSRKDCWGLILMQVIKSKKGANQLHASLNCISHWNSPF